MTEAEKEFLKNALAAESFAERQPIIERCIAFALGEEKQAISGRGAIYSRLRKLGGERLEPQLREDLGAILEGISAEHKEYGAAIKELQSSPRDNGADKLLGRIRAQRADVQKHRRLLQGDIVRADHILAQLEEDARPQVMEEIQKAEEHLFQAERWLLRAESVLHGDLRRAEMDKVRSGLKDKVGICMAAATNFRDTMMQSMIHLKHDRADLPLKPQQEEYLAIVRRQLEQFDQQEIRQTLTRHINGALVYNELQASAGLIDEYHQSFLMALNQQLSLYEDISKRVGERDFLYPRVVKEALKKNQQALENCYNDILTLLPPEKRGDDRSRGGGQGRS